MGLIEMRDYIRTSLLRVYHNKGLNFLNKVCQSKFDEVKKYKGKNVSKEIMSTLGEIAEVQAEAIITEFVKNHKGKVFCVKGLNIRNDEDYLTELDLTIFMESCVILLEVKYRSGSSKITKECQLETKKFKTDIFKQNSLHLKLLHRKIGIYYNKPKQTDKPYKMWLYLESNDYKDIRTKENKDRFKVVTKHTLYEELEKALKESKKWDLKKTFLKVQALDNVSKENEIEHMKRVTNK